MIANYSPFKIQLAKCISYLLYIPFTLWRSWFALGYNPKAKAPHPTPGMGHKASAVPQNILVQDGFFLGDMLMLIPVLQSVQLSYPGAQITLLTGQAATQFMKDCPYIHHIMVMEQPWSSRLRLSKSLITLTQKITKQFDLAIDFHGDPRGLAFLYLCGIPQIVSYADLGGGVFCTQAFTTPQAMHHQFRRHFYLATRMGWVLPKSSKPVWPDWQDRSEQPVHPVHPVQSVQSEHPTARLPSLSQYNVPANYILIHPGASSAFKQWEVSKYQAVIQFFYEQGVQVVLVGGAADQAIIESIVSGLSFACTHVQPDFAGFGSLLKGAKVLLCVDSFAQHAAWALGVPQVILYGPKNAAYTAPFVPGGVHGFPDPHAVIICNNRPWRVGQPWQGPFLMSAIEVNTVIAAIQKQWSN
jgi:ADP-heptose:LPS heptosyltransferase